MTSILIEVGTLTSDEFVELALSVGWNVNEKIDRIAVDQALRATTYTVVARDSAGGAVGAARAFSDDLTMTFIPDLIVRPEHQKSGVGRQLLEKLKVRFGHTIFYFGGQPGREQFFEKCGFKRGMTAFTGRFKPNSFFA